MDIKWRTNYNKNVVYWNLISKKRSGRHSDLYVVCFPGWNNWTVTCSYHKFLNRTLGPEFRVKTKYTLYVLTPLWSEKAGTKGIGIDLCYYYKCSTPATLQISFIRYKSINVLCLFIVHTLFTTDVYDNVLFFRSVRSE